MAAIDERRTRQATMRLPFLLSEILAVSMAVQSVLGLALPGLYRDTGYVGQTWFGNDLVTLSLALPLLVVGLAMDREDSPLGRLLWFGALGYGVYNYAFYLLGAALNAFFLLYVTAFLLATAALVLGLSRTSVSRLASRFDERTPVRWIGGYLTVVAAGLTAVWVGMWAGYVFAGRPAPGGAEAFRLVAALDLTIMVPALTIGGCLLWRRRPWGYLIAAVAAVQGALYLVVLALNGAFFIVRGLVQPPGELPVWGTLAGVTSMAVAVLLRHVTRHW